MSSEVQLRRADILAPGDGPRVYTKEQMMELLSIRPTTYHKLIKPDKKNRNRVMLASSRLYPGGPRVHTQKQYDDYLEYLNTDGVVGAARSDIDVWKKNPAPAKR